MKYIDYKQLNPFQKLAYNVKNFFVSLPGYLVTFFSFLGRSIGNFFKGIGLGIYRFFKRFIDGSWTTRLSYLIMGSGNIFRGQIVKGLLFLFGQLSYIYFMLNFGIYYLGKFGNLGDQATRVVINEYGREVVEFADNSMLILLYGVLTIVVSLVFLVAYISNTRSAYKTEQIVKSGKKPLSFLKELKQFTDERFHVTLLSFPTLTIGIFTILPLIFMILIAFTNYNSRNMPPGNLFTWAGMKTFTRVFNMTSSGASIGHTFVELTKWTVVWAVIATFSNYFFGMILALMINKKGIKFKSLWRTIFVITIAVPQFVSLLLMNQMLQLHGGAINTLINLLGGQSINFLGGSALTARITVLVVNCWVGIPYTILITSGILMNIPEDLYESAKIDGAGPIKSFTKITLPYMLFVTTPYLITQFIGNINNFNVIYLLTNGGPTTETLYQAGHTDLLVTWLFKLTMNSQDYDLAAAIGILVFIVSASLSLITFNLTTSARSEEEFA